MAKKQGEIPKLENVSEPSTSGTSTTVVNEKNDTLEELLKKFDSLTLKTEELTDKNRALNNEVLKLEAKLSIMENNNYVHKCDPVSREIVDRQIRKNNVMLYNLPEKLENRSFNDHDHIQYIFKSMNLPWITPKNVTRIGQYDGRVRPIKICLYNMHDVRLVLQHQHIMKRRPDLVNVVFCPDRTKHQRNHRESTQAEVLRYRESGERNYAIKCFHDVQ